MDEFKDGGTLGGREENQSGHAGLGSDTSLKKNKKKTPNDGDLLYIFFFSYLSHLKNWSTTVAALAEHVLLFCS